MFALPMTKWSNTYLSRITDVNMKPENCNVGPAPKLNTYIAAGRLNKKDEAMFDLEAEMLRIMRYTLHTAYALTPVLAFTFKDPSNPTAEEVEQLTTLTALAQTGASGLNVVYELASRVRRLDWYNQFPDTNIFKV